MPQRKNVDELIDEARSVSVDDSSQPGDRYVGEDKSQINEEASTSDIESAINEYADMFEDEMNEGRIDYPEDAIFEYVDQSVWPELMNGQIGRISSLGTTPRSGIDLDRLLTAVNILKYADDRGYVAQDSGLWDGMDGWQVILAQAFHSLRNVFRLELQDRGLL